MRASSDYDKEPLAFSVVAAIFPKKDAKPLEIKARADRDPDFRKELLREAVETFLSGDAETGKAILRDYINATVGFGTLGKAIDIDPKSLMRMLGPAGNPKTDNLVEIIKYLQTREGVHLKVEAAAIA
jgi:hypothetical protein